MKTALTTFLEAIRVHQWAKNLLLFVPLITGYKIAAPGATENVLIAFLSFSICASSVYLLNDLLDLEADRAHQTKKNRPLASGRLHHSTAKVAIPLLLIASVGLALNLSTTFFVLLALYYLLTLAYSVTLKKHALVDIIVLATLYTIRILAGGAAARIEVSPWLLGFSMFFFLSLALAKRCSELKFMNLSEVDSPSRRGYVFADLEQLCNFGSASGYLSVLVLALWASSVEVRQLYHKPELLWLLCPVLLYWISRLWLITHRGKLDQDPVLFALRDNVSYAAGLVAAIILLFSA